VVGIVIFAMVAAFLGMRLYAVLGKRTGHEQQPLTRPADELLRPANANPARDETRDTAKPLIDSPQAPGAEAGLRAISVADRSFSAGDFIDGAKSAYRLILEAYWAGKEDDFAPYVAEDVRAAFAESITERTSEGHVLDNRLVTIERALITDASLSNGVAHITIKFVADIAAVTRDADGKVIAGSLTDAVPTEDVWIFTRDVRSADPNWILTDTDEAA
jgi:predicted lipid-binding transport protein (Tim44 family)